MIGFLAYDKSKVDYVTGEVIHVKDEVHSQYTLDHFTISPEAYDAVGTSNMPKPWHNDFDPERQGLARVETIG